MRGYSELLAGKERNVKCVEMEETVRARIIVMEIEVVKVVS